MEKEPQKEQIEGSVSAVVYQNEENGYTVLRLRTKEEELTAVGCIPGAAVGELLSLEGQWVNHAAYGRQFKADVARRRLPEGADAVLEFLSSGIIRGVGMTTARRLVDEFGGDTLRVVEQEPEKLTKVRGITPRRAQQISDAFRQQMGMRTLLEFLTAHGLPAQLGMPLYRRFGSRAQEEIETNPYLLVDEELGVPFSAADQLAIDLGLEGDDPLRLEAGLLFELQHNLNNGHTFLPRDKLLLATQQLLTQEEDSLEAGLDAMLESGTLFQETISGVEAVYLPDLREGEDYVARRLLAMSGNELRAPDGLERVIGDIQREQGITYAVQQREAIRLAATRQVMLLTGGPGTGKTTSLRGVLALFDYLGLHTELTAPTGRAAKRLGDLCGQEAATIHRLLETQFDPDSGRLVFTHDEEDPLDADAVIVDETSMVDIVLMRALLGALRSDCRLLLVGDPDQLPSVGPGNLLSDLLRSGVLPTVRLTEIFRQAAESAIVRSAHGINRGELPDLRANSGDFFFLSRNDPERAVSTIVELCKTRLPDRMGIPADQIQVLSPTRKGVAGTANLNRALQEALNPPKEGKRERSWGDLIFREGDRVMQVKNNYDVMWRETGGLRAGMGIFNGDIGTITGVEPGDGVLTVDFEGRQVEYTADMFSELEPAYAVTVHKAQGSEYRAVILAAMSAPPMLLTRGVLYTAVTRAKELFIIVGEENVISAMTANSRQTRRYSGLRCRLTGGGAGEN